MESMSGSGAIALVCAVLGAMIVIGYLIKRPPFDLRTQLMLFLGLGVLPIASAAAGNVAGMHATKQVQFCSSCHVMLAHTGDVKDPKSQSLAARHSRNALFGEESCYTCHADYGMFGAVFTKINGLHHVERYLLEYRKYTLDEALPKLELYKPMPNKNCMQCHSTTNKLWYNLGDHEASIDDVRSGKVSCASEGCHGFAHPFTKAAREAAKAKGQKGAPDTNEDAAKETDTP